MRATMSSLAAFSAGFCVKVWSFIVGVFLFIPRLVHNLAVRPDDDQDHGGGHVLVWEFGQVRRLLHPFSRVASRPALGRSVGRSVDPSLRDEYSYGPPAYGINRRTGICRLFCAHSPSRRGTWMTSCGSRCSRATSDGTVIDCAMIQWFDHPDDQLIDSCRVFSRAGPSSTYHQVFRSV